MSILTIDNNVLEGDLDRLIERWSRNDGEVVGHVNDSRHCPLATLFKEEYENVYFIRVDREEFVVLMDGHDERIKVPVSDPLQTFIRRVDWLGTTLVLAREAVAILKEIQRERI